jgi:adenylate cyclase
MQLRAMPTRVYVQAHQLQADKHLWAQSYQGSLGDTLAVQNQVASAIADEIRVEITPQEQEALKSAKKIDPEAYEAYLKGRYLESTNGRWTGAGRRLLQSGHIQRSELRCSL